MLLFRNCVVGFGWGLLIVAFFLAFLSFGCVRKPSGSPAIGHIHGVCSHVGVQGGAPFQLDEDVVFTSNGALIYPTPVGPVTLTGAQCIYQRN